MPDQKSTPAVTRVWEIAKNFSHSERDQSSVYRLYSPWISWGKPVFPSSICWYCNAGLGTIWKKDICCLLQQDASTCKADSSAQDIDVSIMNNGRQTEKLSEAGYWKNSGNSGHTSCREFYGNGWNTFWFCMYIIGLCNLCSGMVLAVEYIWCI